MVRRFSSYIYFNTNFEMYLSYIRREVFIDKFYMFEITLGGIRRRLLSHRLMILQYAKFFFDYFQFLVQYLCLRDHLKLVKHLLALSWLLKIYQQV